MPDTRLVGGIELGGTKTVLAVGLPDGRIVRRETIATRDPDTVMNEACTFFRAAGPVHAVGVGAFGPVVIDPAHNAYGRLLETNKPGWSGFDLLGALTRALGVPAELVTDVGAAAIGEARLGALQSAALGIYLTVGTGIGGAIVCNGALLPAMLHPEMGHIALRRLADDGVTSTCRFHSDCAEGLAAGPAIIRRFGQSLSHFAEAGHERLLIAAYLGQLCANLVLTLSPHRIVMGGGVSQTPGLIPLVGEAMRRHLGGYAVAGTDAPEFLCLPELGQDAGITGALLCGARAMPSSRLAVSAG